MLKNSSTITALRFVCNYKTVSLIVATLVSSMVSLYFASAEPGASASVFQVGFCVLLSVMIIAYLADVEAGLSARSNDENNFKTWSVSVNDVETGVISDRDLADICLASYFDWRIYILQLLNLGKILIRLINSLIMVVPLAVFWVGVLLFYFDPSTFSEVAQAVADLPQVAANTYEAPSPSGFFYGLLGLIAVLSLIKFALGIDLGFVNQFTIACSKRVRWHVHCPAEGDIDLVLESRDCRHIPNCAPAYD